MMNAERKTYFCIHRSSFCIQVCPKFSSIFSPTAWLFSGWNCVVMTLSRQKATGERLAVVAGRGDDARRFGRPAVVAVNEVDAVARQAREQRRRPRDVERVPPHVRHLQAQPRVDREPHAVARDHAQPGCACRSRGRCPSASACPGRCPGTAGRGDLICPTIGLIERRRSRRCARASATAPTPGSTSRSARPDLPWAARNHLRLVHPTASNAFCTERRLARP